MNTFSPTEAIKFGWTMFKKNPLFLIGILIAIYVIEFVIGLIFGMVKFGTSSSTFTYNQPFSLWNSLGQLINFIVSMVLSLGLIKALLNLVDTGKGNFADIFSEITNFKLIINYFINTILVGLIVIGGLILLVLPGLYFAIRLGFAPYFLVDKNIGATEALKASWKATSGNVINIIVFGLLCLGVGLLGLLALGIGLIVAIPIISVAGVYVYKMLSKEAAPAAPSTPVAPPVASAT